MCQIKTHLRIILTKFRKICNNIPKVLKKREKEFYQHKLKKNIIKSQLKYAKYVRIKMFEENIQL